MNPAALMVQGTGSDVGKSLVIAGLCRAYARRGLEVRPFKPQNMSNNAAVTSDGGEIGRAQALQARACGTPAESDMNPVLLKPETDLGSQVVVQGKVWRHAKAGEYRSLKPRLLAKVLESFRRLGGAADLVLVEGAGSPAEVNLRASDITNMGFAEAAGVPVALLGDIDRGGVIAQLVGTWILLSDSERARLRGYIVNKFRGDIDLFESGLAEISGRTGLECLGVVPHFADAHHLPAEDAVALDTYRAAGEAPIRICVPAFSRIANFDDLDPLIAEPDVRLDMVRPGEPVPGDADLVILPGSKTTIADLEVLREQGWDIDILAHRRRGGAVLGICGGFQMLGRRVADPTGIEGKPGAVPGLGLLEVETELSPGKTLEEIAGEDVATGAPVRGYSMHTGHTCGAGLERPMLRLGGESDGAVSADGGTQGCYLHGLFASDGFRHAFLDRLRRREAGGLAYEAMVEAALDGLAEHLEGHLPLDRLLEIARVG